MPDVPTRILQFDKTLGKKALKDIRNNCSALVLHEQNLWIGGDEGTSVDRLTRDAAGNFGQHTRFDLVPLLGLAPREKTEIDIEGLDVNGGCLWVVGSHSLKRTKTEDGKTDAENFERLAKVTPDPNRFTLARVPLKKSGADFEPVAQDNAVTAARLDGDDHGNLLTKALEGDPHLGRFVPRFSNGEPIGIPSKDNGLDIEGLAVSGNRVFLGLRGPVLRGWAVVLELRVAESRPGVLTLEPFSPTAAYRKHFLQLGGLGVRDLVIHGQDLYVLCGPTMDLDGPVFIYRWANALGQSSDTLVFEKNLEPNSLPFGVKEDHAEGMTLIEGPLSAMVCYDSPAKARTAGLDEGGVKVDVFLL